MDDPSQSAAQAAGRQDRALQEKMRAKLQEGAMTGLVERNSKVSSHHSIRIAAFTSKPRCSPIGLTLVSVLVAPQWDVEYEGKDAIGTLVRPFEPGWGDSRALPSKMLGEDISAAVARSMGRALPHSGAGDGKKVFKTDDDPEKLRAMIKAEADKDGVGRHFSAGKPKSANEIRNEKHLARLNREFPGSPVMKGGKFDAASTYSRGSPTAHKHAPAQVADSSGLPRSRDKPLRNEGAHAMLDRMGPNIASGPIPRDGFTTNAYEDLTRDRLHKLGFSDILGETVSAAARPPSAASPPGAAASPSSAARPPSAARLPSCFASACQWPSRFRYRACRLCCLCCLRCQH